MSRAFKSIDNQITTGGDYIEALRRKTMYLSIARKVKTAEGAASIVKYDNDVNIKWCEGGNRKNSKPTAKLKSTINYKTLLDISKGKRQANPVLNGSTASKFNIFTGNFAMVHGNQPYPLIVPFIWDSGNKTNKPYLVTGPTPPTPPEMLPIANTITFPNNGQSENPMDASWNLAQYPGWWFDPFGVLTEENCIATNANNLGAKLVNQVEIAYRWSHAYWRSVAGQSMSGFAFPESVSFALQPTDYTSELTQRYGPLPTSDAYIIVQAALGGDPADTINRQQESQLIEWCQAQGSENYGRKV